MVGDKKEHVSLLVLIRLNTLFFVNVDEAGFSPVPLSHATGFMTALPIFGLRLVRDRFQRGSGRLLPGKGCGGDQDGQV